MADSKSAVVLSEHTGIHRFQFEWLCAGMGLLLVGYRKLVCLVFVRALHKSQIFTLKFAGFCLFGVQISTLSSLVRTYAEKFDKV